MVAIASAGSWRPPNGYQRADNGTGHMLQKAIRIEHKDEALSVSEDPQAKETAPWVTRRAGGGPESRKIVTTQEHTGRRPHGRKGQRLWHMPGIGGP